MSWIRFLLTLALVVAATVSGALLQGRMRHRWGPATAAGKTAARLQEFLPGFDEWQATSACREGQECRNQLECAEHTIPTITDEAP